MSRVSGIGAYTSCGFICLDEVFFLRGLRSELVIFRVFVERNRGMLEELKYVDKLEVDGYFIVIFRDGIANT